MRIYSWNINGIRSVSKKGFSNWLKDNPADIYCFQEVRALPEQIDPEFTPYQGYHCFWNPAEKKGYSGTSLWSKEKPISITNGLGIEELDSEGRTQIAEFEDFVLYNIYYPNGGASEERLQYKMRFYDAFLKHANAQSKPVIVCGDFNTCHKEIDIARPKANAKKSGFLPMEREWMDKMFADGYADTFREIHGEMPDRYSWWSNRGGARERNVGWRIDYFVVSKPFMSNVKDAEIHDQHLGSDHCPISLEFST